jgi:RPA family protein
MGLAHAATTTSGQQTLVDKIATKFNLKTEDVQKVFDEERAAHQAEAATQFKTKLDEAVKDGKLTQAQEDKLIAKQKELQAAHDANKASMKDKTKAERKAAMEAERTAFKQWLTDNGIPAEYGMLMHGGHHGGPGGPR